MEWKQISEWERGNAKPPKTKLIRIAKQGEWPIDIFAEGGPMPSEVVNRAVNEIPEEPEHPWVDADDERIDQLLRDLLHNVEYTVRGAVTNQASLRDLRLATIKGLEAQYLDRGAEVPNALHRIKNEVSTGTFR